MSDLSASGTPVSPQGGRVLDRRIVALALPALGALVAEPVFVLVDTAVVGHLGAPELAGLALAGTVLTTVVGLCVFLAYATTAGVARALGAGDRRRALRLGVDGIWLAVLLGTALAALLVAAAGPVVDALGAPDDVRPHALAYLRWSAPGLPGMLAVLAATGALRGRLNTRTPLWVAVGGALLNAVLSVALVVGAGMGVAGSGLGTAIAQTAMAAVLVPTVAVGARADGVGLRPSWAGLRSATRAGVPLLLRTVSLRAGILLAAWVATGLGTAALAGHQVVSSVWSFAAFALDALAIAAQALVGQALGAGDAATARAVLRRTLAWGVGAGAVLGVILAAGSGVVGPLFTPEAAVHDAVAPALLVVAVGLPLAGWTFVLDGVLIGAGDGRFLAWAGVATVLAYAPAALAVRALAPDGAHGLVWAWLAYAGVFMGARALTTGLRSRTDRWARLGT